MKCEGCQKEIIWDEHVQVVMPDGKHYHWGCEPKD